MKAQQLLYYSWQGVSHAGFGLFAKSTGISEEEAGEINSNLAYIAPTSQEPFSGVVQQIMSKLSPESFPTTGEYGIAPELQKMLDDTFPVNYVHCMLSSGRHCYARVGYCGLDYQKVRWANYVLHAYVTDAPYPGSISALFTCNPFKRCMSVADMGPQTPPESLPEIDLAVKTLEPTSVGSLTQKLGEQNVARFLVALIKSAKEKLPLYVNAKGEDILRYMTLAQAVLPPVFTKDLTFSTYLFNEEQGGDYRIRYVYADGYAPFDYASRARSDSAMVLDYRNGVFSVEQEDLTLICTLLNSDPAGTRFSELQTLIADHYGVIHDYNGAQLLRYDALLKDPNVADQSTERLLADLQSNFWKLPRYAGEARRIVLAALQTDRSIAEALPLFDYVYANHTDHRAMLVPQLVRRVYDAAFKKQFSVVDAVKLLKEHCQGEAIAYYFAHFTELKKDPSSREANVFHFLMLAEAWNGSVGSAAEGALMQALRENTQHSIQEAPFWLDLLAFSPELQRKGYAFLFRLAGNAVVYETLIAYGQGLSPKDPAFEAEICGLIVGEAQKAPLLSILLADSAASRYAVDLCFRKVGDTKLGQACRDLLWVLLEKQAVLLRKTEVLCRSLKCFSDEPERYLAILQLCLQQAGESQTYRWMTESLSGHTDVRFLLSALYKGDARALGVRYLTECVKDTHSYLDYLDTWYQKGSYTECFATVTESMHRQGVFADPAFLKQTLVSLRPVFLRSGHEKEVVQLSSIVQVVCLGGLPRVTGWTPILNELSAALKAQHLEVPQYADFIRMAESANKREYTALLTVSNVSAFISSLNTQAYVGYVAAYLEPLTVAMDQCVNCEPVAALALLVTGTGNDVVEQGFAKLMLKGKRDRHTRICNLTELYFSYGKEAMSQAVCQVLNALSVGEYLNVVTELRLRHNSKKLDLLFERAQGDMGFFRRLRFRRALKRAEKKRVDRSTTKKKQTKKGEQADGTKTVRHDERS